MNYKSLFHLIRPLNLLMIGFGHLLTFLFLVDFDQLGFWFFGSGPILLTAIGGYVVNNFFDRQKDLENQKPIIVLATSYWISLYCLLLLFSLTLSAMGGLNFMVVVLITHVVLFLYAKYFSNWFLSGNFSVSVCLSFSIIAFYFMDNMIINIYDCLLLGTSIFLISMAREMVKDVLDIKGDQLAGANTFAIVMGLKSVNLMVQLFLMVHFILLLGLFIFSLKMAPELVIGYLGFLVIFNLLLCFFPLFKRDLTEKYYFWSLGLKVFMALGLMLIPILNYV